MSATQYIQIKDKDRFIEAVKKIGVGFTFDFTEDSKTYSFLVQSSETEYPDEEELDEEGRTEYVVLKCEDNYYEFVFTGCSELKYVEGLTPVYKEITDGNTDGIYFYKWSKIEE